MTVTINLAAKYSDKVDERFTLQSVITPAVNQDYEWVGVKTVKVYSINTVDENDYTRSGGNRYGTPAELGDSVQEMSVTQDKSFTFTIDKGNNNEQLGVKNAGKALSRQLNEKTIPNRDIYVLGKMILGAGNVKNSETITSSNAYSAFLDGQEALSDNKVPQAGRICYCTNAYYKKIKQDDSFIKNADLAQEKIFNGQVGMVDGVPIIPLPASYLTSGTNFVITHPCATVAPVKLAEYKIHKDPPGISGDLAEGRTIYDAFVLDNKANAIYVSTTTSAG